jgi:dihydrofolate reductase
MGTIVVTENATLDGVIEQIGDWFAPAAGDADNADIVATLREQMQTQTALLLGRKPFESFRKYWPAQTGDTTGIRAHLNRVAKYVFSRTLEEPGWENTTVLSGDLADEARGLKARVNGKIGVTGSSSRPSLTARASSSSSTGSCEVRFVTNLHDRVA